MTPSKRIKVCAVPRCLAQVPPKCLYCPGHWKLIPPDLQETIAVAWKVNPAGLPALHTEVLLATHRQRNASKAKEE